MGILIFLVLIIFIITIAFLIIFWRFNQPLLPSLNLKELKPKNSDLRVLFLFPHPDDETMAAGGLISVLTQKKWADVRVIVATKGEAGDELVKLAPRELGDLREREYTSALRKLEVADQDFAMWDFPDGGLSDLEVGQKLRQSIKIELAEFSPQIVVTFEDFGIYGHPDHIALTKVLKDTVATDFPQIRILQVTLPRRVLELIELPNHMAVAPKELAEPQLEPELKFVFGPNVFKKYAAAKLYESQRILRLKPTAVYYFFNWIEYFAWADSDSTIQ